VRERTSNRGPPCSVITGEGVGNGPSTSQVSEGVKEVGKEGGFSGFIPPSCRRSNGVLMALAEVAGGGGVRGGNLKASPERH